MKTFFFLISNISNSIWGWSFSSRVRITVLCFYSHICHQVLCHFRENEGNCLGFQSTHLQNGNYYLLIICEVLYKSNALAHTQWLSWEKGVHPAYPIMLWTLILLKKEYDGILSHTERWVAEKYEVKKGYTSEFHISVKTFSWAGT